MRISYWSSDVCSSDLAIESAIHVIDGGTHSLMTSRFGVDAGDPAKNVIWDLHRPENKSLAINKEALMLVIDRLDLEGQMDGGIQIMRQAVPFWGSNINKIGRASCRERVCQYV